MKSFKSWVYPALFIAVWLVVAAFSISGLSTVGPSVRSIAAAQSAGPQNAGSPAAKENSSVAQARTPRVIRPRSQSIQGG